MEPFFKKTEERKNRRKRNGLDDDDTVCLPILILFMVGTKGTSVRLACLANTVNLSLASSLSTCEARGVLCV